MMRRIQWAGGRRRLPPAIARLALALVASGGGVARADDAAPVAAVADAAASAGDVPPVAPVSAAAAAARAAARVAARAVPNSARAPCPSRAASAAAAIHFVPAHRSADVWFVPFTAASRPARVATVPRQPDSPVAAVALPGTDQVAVSVIRRAERDPTWSATLFLAAPGRQARVLLERVFAGGPLVATEDRRVFAVRGAAGPERAPTEHGGAFRRDALEVVMIDATADDVQVRVLSRQTGDALFLVGASGKELFAYRVGGRDAERPGARQPQSSRGGAPSGELVSIDLETGAARVVVAEMPPLARDFSFDAVSRTIWFAAVRPAGEVDGSGKGTAAAREPGGRYALYALDLATARPSVVVAGDSLAFVPQAWPGERVAFRCQDGSNALCLANRTGARDRQVAHLIGNASGSVEVQLVSCTDAGELAFGVRSDAGRSFPTPFVWAVGDTAARDVALPSGQVRFVGVVDLAAAAGGAGLPALAPAAR